MSTGNYNTNQTRSFTHLDFKERQLIEKWLNEDVNKAEIGRRLGRCVLQDKCLENCNQKLRTGGADIILDNYKSGECPCTLTKKE